MSQTDMTRPPTVTPEIRRLVIPFRERYKQAQAETAQVRAQAQAAVDQAQAVENHHLQVLLEACALALGGDLKKRLDWETWEISDVGPAPGANPVPMGDTSR